MQNRSGLETGGANGSEVRSASIDITGVCASDEHPMEGEDPVALRNAALRAVRANCVGGNGFKKAEQLLIRALRIDPDDRSGETHYLLGLTYFHMECWNDAQEHLKAALERNPENTAAKELLERARTNEKTHVERPMGPRDSFNREELLAPPVLEKSKDIAPLEPAERPGIVREALLSIGNTLLGWLADGLIIAVYLLRDRKPVFAFESWDRRGPLRGQLELGGLRRKLNKRLESTYEGLVGHQKPGQQRPEWTQRFRTATGAWTTDDPMEGAAGTEIQRSGAPLATRTSRVQDLPSAREVSRRMLASRGKREEAKFLNLLALAWIQAQLHDWASHQMTLDESAHAVELRENDPLRKLYCVDALAIAKTAANPTRSDGKLAFLTECTHWWDASHIYGSDKKTQDRLRGDEPDGKMRIDGDLLPINPATGIEDTGFSRNWWVGLTLFHTLFVKHHNYICEALKDAYPNWSSDQLFHTARLVNAAIIAKIHTVEWTPAVLPNNKVVPGMATNWWGLFEGRKPFAKRRTRRPSEPVHPALGGIVGGKRDNHGKPYGLTEEFVEVYRFHAGIPDAIQLRSIAGEPSSEPIPTDETRGAMARELVQKYGMATLFISFGHQHMPALVHNNYPAFIGAMSVDGQAVIDLGTIDILRARERGVPPYNEFRRMLGLNRIKSFGDLGCDADTVEELEELYKDDVDRMDLLVGTSCELKRPTNFGFGETLFTLFIQMASRRLQADPFFTDKFNARYYTKEGMELIEKATLKDILLQHYPELGNTGLAKLNNPFEPWGTTPATHPEEHPLAGIENYGTPLRLREFSTNISYIVDLARGAVYSDEAKRGWINAADEIPGADAMRMLKSAQEGVRCGADVPGRTTPDGEFEVRGYLTRKEAQLLAGVVPIERPALLMHLDFFDGDLNGRIWVWENYRGWRRLGFTRGQALWKTLLSSVAFGRVLAGFAIDVERIGAKRHGGTGIYDQAGKLNQKRLNEYLEAFDDKGRQLSFDEVNALLDKHSVTGKSRRQFKSLFQVCERLNDGKKGVTKAQFQGLFDGSLLWQAAAKVSEARSR